MVLLIYVFASFCFASSQTFHTYFPDPQNDMLLYLSLMGGKNFCPFSESDRQIYFLQPCQDVEKSSHTPGLHMIYDNAVQVTNVLSDANMNSSSFSLVDLNKKHMQFRIINYRGKVRNRSQPIRRHFIDFITSIPISHPWMHISGWAWSLYHRSHLLNCKVHQLESNPIWKQEYLGKLFPVATLHDKSTGVLPARKNWNRLVQGSKEPTLAALKS